MRALRGNRLKAVGERRDLVMHCGTHGSGVVDPYGNRVTLETPVEFPTERHRVSGETCGKQVDKDPFCGPHQGEK